MTTQWKTNEWVRERWCWLFEGATQIFMCKRAIYLAHLRIEHFANSRPCSMHRVSRWCLPPENCIASDFFRSFRITASFFRIFQSCSLRLVLRIFDSSLQRENLFKFVSSRCLDNFIVALVRQLKGLLSLITHENLPNLPDSPHSDYIEWSN